MNTYFIADTHFGHGNIIKYCERNQFLSNLDREELERQGGKWHDGDWKGDRASKWRITREAVELMDDTIINNINRMVKSDDVLWHLGDFCFGSKDNYYRTAANYRRRINCQTINFIWGNHDHRNIRDLFNECYDQFEVNVNKQSIVLNHYAMLTFNKSHRQGIALYGHSHGNLEKWADKVMPGRRSMDVGIDNAIKILGEYRPFSFEEIMHIMSKRNGYSFDHHGMRTGPTEEELIE